MTYYLNYYNLTNFSISRDYWSLLPNVVEQAVKNSNEYLASKNRPPLSQEVISLIETQVLSIKEPEHKIKMLVGNIIVCIVHFEFPYSYGYYFRKAI